ncbi:hypothetical protein ACSSS7_004129 [Eimeria intestinalis]
MAAAKAPLSSPRGSAGSPDDHSTCLQELRSHIAAQSGRLVLVSESERGNGYSVYYQVLVLSLNPRRNWSCTDRQHEHSELNERNDELLKDVSCIDCQATGSQLCLLWWLMRAASSQQRKHLQKVLRRGAAEVAASSQARRKTGQRPQICGGSGAPSYPAPGREGKTEEADATGEEGERQEAGAPRVKVCSGAAGVCDAVGDRCREELERRAAELRSKIEAREKQAHALRSEHLQKIRRKCAATAERTSLASTVTSTDKRNSS